MPSPFPGMDPYLEEREHWRGFHHYLADSIVRQLNPLIVPKYFADVEVHTSIEEVQLGELHHSYPDAVVLERQPNQPLSPISAAIVIPEAPLQLVVDISGEFKVRTVEVRETETRQLVTSIEILSPVNKSGDGLEKYRRKRSRILRSAVHLIEIDLLRGGTRPGPEVDQQELDVEYISLVNRARHDDIRISSVWPIALNEKLPILPVPLREEDADVPLDLSRIISAIYDDFYYGLRIDYNRPIPPPTLRPAMQQWLLEEGLIQKTYRNGTAS